MLDRYAGIRSVMETPILDERKWAKVPQIPADAFLLDLEDSAPVAHKETARERVVDVMRQPEHLGGRLPLPRVNDLSTPWGRADLEAVAAAGAGAVVYPKVRSARELREAQAVLRAGGCDPDLFPVIETAQGVLEVAAIAAVDRVAGLLFGPSDLAVDAGFELFEGRDLALGRLLYARSAIILAGAAHGLCTFDIPFVADLRDLDAVRAQAVRSRRDGFTGMATFYPPHVEVINRAFTPSAAEIAEAERIVRTYEAALAGGSAAVAVDGKALIVQDYKRARALIARAA